MSDTKGEAKGGLKSNTLTNSQTQYTNFLFGENLAERVLLPAKEEASNDTKKEEEKTENGDENGENSVSSQNLPEKRKYEVITGEEDESNVLQIFCKLYLWDSTSAFWKEKGKGMLRLNDKMKDDKTFSRLVMRTAGSLKVILNASIVPGMKFELSNENCLRFINIDGIYLFKGKEKEIELLNSSIESRLRELSKKVKVDDNDQTNTEDNLKEPSESDNSKTLEDSTEESKEEEEESKEESKEDGKKEELEKPDNEGSQSKKELEKSEDLDENSRKENVPEEENKTKNEQNDDHEEKEEEKQQLLTETNKNNSKEETPSSPSPSPPDLDQK